MISFSKAHFVHGRYFRSSHWCDFDLFLVNSFPDLILLRHDVPPPTLTPPRVVARNIRNLSGDLEEPQFTPSGTGSEPEGVVIGKEAAEITPERVPREEEKDPGWGGGDTPSLKLWERKRTG